MLLERSTGDPALDDLIRRKLRYSQSRWVEVWMACIMVVFGGALLCPGASFSSPGFAVIASYADEDQAGFLMLGVGVMRLVALYINGRRRETPIPRVLGCMVGALLFGMIGIGIAMTAPPVSTGLIYFVLSMAEMVSSHRAGGDVFATDALGTRHRRRAREAEERRATEERRRRDGLSDGS